MRTRKNFLAASFAIMATLVVTAAVSWACTKSGYVAVSPGSAPAGSVVSVSGGEFRSHNVEIRWNGNSGPLLAVAQGPSFSVRVTIPAGAAPDVYYISLAQEGYAYASAPFTVTTGSPTSVADTESTAQDGSTATTSSGSTSGAGTTSGAGGGYSVAPAPGTSSSPASVVGSDDSASPTGGANSGSTAGTSSDDAAPSRVPVADQRRAEAVTGAAPGPSSAAAPQVSSATNASGASPAGLTASGKPIVVGGQAGPDGQPVVEQPVPVSAMPSNRTVSGDVWGGFAGGLTRSNLEPSLGVAGQGGSDNARALALGLLGLGTFGMLAGLSLTVRGRRRQLANAGHVSPTV